VLAGAPCETSIGGNACVDGTYCDNSQPGGAKCSPVVGRGHGCQSPYECVAGTRCINNLCSAGVERDSCASDADCGAGLRCGINRCVKVKELGEDCAPNMPCREGDFCYTTCSTCSVCAPRPRVGEECDVIGDRACYHSRCQPAAMPMEPAFCAESFADGEACGTASECKLGRVCSEMKCELYTPDCSAL
jgi:hypothetical protein